MLNLKRGAAFFSARRPISVDDEYPSIFRARHANEHWLAGEVRDTNADATVDFIAFPAIIRASTVAALLRRRLINDKRLKSHICFLMRFFDRAFSCCPCVRDLVAICPRRVFVPFLFVGITAAWYTDERYRHRSERPLLAVVVRFIDFLRCCGSAGVS